MIMYTRPDQTNQLRILPRELAQHATPITLHHLTPDTHFLVLYLSLLLPWCQPSLPNQTDTILTTRASTNPYLCPLSSDRKGMWHSSSGGPMPVCSECVYSPGPLRIRHIRVTRVPEPVGNAYKYIIASLIQQLGKGRLRKADHVK
ncbi:hypothetical protein TIFTF001_040845 [Ficus carica]|uniref:Uncharacterized protein n=1 Tax=Ficus carica TaxID=3494 RepID=A0AA88D482_FICCA|nr:hypothetical protein TIFTF001_040845 [Ficus carica]